MKIRNFHQNWCGASVHVYNFDFVIGKSCEFFHDFVEYVVGWDLKKVRWMHYEEDEGRMKDRTVDIINNSVHFGFDPNNFIELNRWVDLRPVDRLHCLNDNLANVSLCYR